MVSTRPLDGQAPDAFAVVNSRGLPSTKAEVVQEIRALAKSAGAVGHFTGHSLRVTGAQRLAFAGVSEAKSAAFGRWASGPFRLYVRDAVLGSNGGDLAIVKEGKLRKPQTTNENLEGPMKPKRTIEGHPKGFKTILII